MSKHTPLEEFFRAIETLKTAIASVDTRPALEAVKRSAENANRQIAAAFDGFEVPQIPSTEEEAAMVEAAQAFENPTREDEQAEAYARDTAVISWWEDCAKKADVIATGPMDPQVTIGSMDEYKARFAEAKTRFAEAAASDPLNPKVKCTAYAWVEDMNHTGIPRLSANGTKQVLVTWEEGAGVEEPEGLARRGHGLRLMRDRVVGFLRAKALESSMHDERQGLRDAAKEIEGWPVTPPDDPNAWEEVFREQRDEAQEKIAEMLTERATLRQQRTDAKADRDWMERNLERERSELQATIATLTKERDTELADGTAHIQKLNDELEAAAKDLGEAIADRDEARKTITRILTHNPQDPATVLGPLREHMKSLETLSNGWKRTAEAAFRDRDEAYRKRDEAIAERDNWEQTSAKANEASSAKSLEIATLRRDVGALKKQVSDLQSTERQREAHATIRKNDIFKQLETVKHLLIHVTAQTKGL